MAIDYLSYEPVELSFGTSGLRGLVTDMTDLECYINVAGFLSYLAELGQLGGTVYIAGDLRASTPCILRAVATAISDASQETVFCGFIPTPAVAYYAQTKGAPCIMVTGSHIPDDRNGIKFYKADGEVLKSDEAAIKNHVAEVRAKTYDSLDGKFTSAGELIEPAALPEVAPEAETAYKARYTDVFSPTVFKGKKIVMYQHSAVGRDTITDVLKSLGAEVVPVGRSSKFIPIDTENVTIADQQYFKQLAEEHEELFAIVSTDGDSDRPFVIDEQGVFNRGDVLGAVVAEALQADYAAYPISSSDALDRYFDEKGLAYEHTRIGSPYVIDAMNAAIESGKERVVGWEVNGGFLIGKDLEIDGKSLEKLATRDALFPILMALKMAVDSNQTVSSVFAVLPQRYTQAGLIDNFPVEVSKALMQKFSTNDEQTRKELGRYFNEQSGFSSIAKVDSLDGVRIFFSNGDIAHMRPSGNAPQLRIYSVSDSQERADEIVRLALEEGDGIFRRLEQAYGQERNG